MNADFLSIITTAGDTLADFSPPFGETMSTQKGIASKAPVNIKNMSNGNVLATLPVNGWVLGDYSVTKSDLINITAYYRPSGEKVTLPFPCKATASGLTITPYTDTTTPPTPEPLPTGEPVQIIELRDGLPPRVFNLIEIK